MKKRKSHSSLKTGVVVGTFAFVVLSFFTAGGIEFSHELGLMSWLTDLISYAVFNKLLYKLVATVSLGLCARFIRSMIEYGKEIEAEKHNDKKLIQFRSNDTEVGKIA